MKGKKEEYKEKEFRKNARAARLRYKNKVEEKFRTGNAREAWSGLRAMMGKQQTLALMLGTSVRTVPHRARLYSVPEQLDLSEADVVTSFSRLNLHKASGPDGLKGRTLKNCATQLGKIFTLIFQ